MDPVESETESKKARNARSMSKLKVGCLVLLLLGVGAMLVAREVLHYEFSVASVMTLSLELEGGKAYVYCSGFGDVSCDYYVSFDNEPDRLYYMGAWDVESPYHGSFYISANRKLVVTESDIPQTTPDPSNTDPDGSQRQALYTHAVDRETRKYIAPKGNLSNEDEAARRARNEAIASMLEAYGGIGSSFTLSREEFQTRPLGYWEWRRWQRMVNAAHTLR